jgi:hypothetical protein
MIVSIINNVGFSMTYRGKKHQEPVTVELTEYSQDIILTLPAGFFHPDQGDFYLLAALRAGDINGNRLLHNALSNY